MGTVATVGGHAVTMVELGLAVALALLALLTVALRRSHARTAREREEDRQAREIEAAELATERARDAMERAARDAAAEARARELDDKLAEANRLQAEMTGRMQTMAEIFGTRQADMARLMTERLDGFGRNVAERLHQTAHATGENLTKLNERLAVIDAAQGRLSEMTSEILTLRDVLANKQSRGAFGQGRMEAIVRDALPVAAYEFQATLSNRSRPDCLIRLPGDERPLVVDAKFPLEGFSAFRESRGDDGRLAAAKRVKTDVNVHVRDVADKYLIPGETQDLAMIFVPSESIYADLHEHFDDVIQAAHRRRVLIVSPAVFSLAIQVMQSLVRDQRMREQANLIQAEVRRLLEDVKRLRDRTGKLETHFRQAQEDVGQIVVSTDKVMRRGERIDALEFEDGAPPQRGAVLRVVD